MCIYLFIYLFGINLRIFFLNNFFFDTKIKVWMIFFFFKEKKNSNVGLFNFFFFGLTCFSIKKEEEANV